MRTTGWVRRLWVMVLLLPLAAFVGGVNASAADEIVIGVMGPMKFTFGANMKNGAELAADEINAKGGITVKGKKYKVVLTVVDDNSFLSTPDAVSAMERLATVSKVKYVVGGFKTESVLAQQEVMADNKVIFLGCGSAHEEQCRKVARDYNRYKYWFRVGPPPSIAHARLYLAMAEPAIKALKKQLGITKPRVAFLIDKAQFAEPYPPMAEKIFPAMGCEIVGIWRPSFTATSVAAELSAIKSAGAHIIVVVNAGPSGNVISRQWGELKIPAAMVGINVEAQRAMHWKTTDGMCNYLATSAPIADITMTPKTRPFLTAYTKRFGEAPIYTGLDAYDSLYILKDAMERANSLDPDALVPALEKTNYLGAAYRIAFRPVGTETPHDLILGPKNAFTVGMQWRDGKQYVVWPDGRELNQAFINAGLPKGWDKLKFKGTSEYVLPPWVVEYWKGKK